MRMARIFAIAFITGFSGAMMPGPMLMLVLGQAPIYGMAAVWAIVAGHAVLEIIIVLLLVAGLRPILQRPALRGALGLVGGAVMAWSGVLMMLQADSVALVSGAPPQRVPWVLLLAQGAWVSITNPYFTGWWATIGSGQLAHAAPCNRREYGAFYLGHELSDLVWFALVGLVVLTGATWLSPTVYTWLILVSGAVLVALSLWFIWTGIRFIWLGAGDDAANLPTAEIMGEVCAGAGAGAPGTEEDP